ncbi:hypothetical protein RhiirA4_460110 [Rhizophagus irregularis]|uniref:Uncharacterized protein n=1 Tax=Rhizophagus irregularis TaxID=588596 RepID=A0A2I1GFV8_9GLOM|nr:hypothetical protein RhiirA4_460110 [Rhizophagus irregularis]
MELNVFEGEITNVIDTVEEIRIGDHSQIVQQIATVYFYMIDEFLKNPFIFVNKKSRYQEFSEIEYVMAMTRSIINTVFSDTFDYIKLRWEEILSNFMSDRYRKIDLRIVHKAKNLELSHSECTKTPTPEKAVQDRSNVYEH